MTHDTPTPRPFVILAMPRTGTHYLEELLNEHPTVLSNGELLNEYDTNWPGKDRLLRPDRELLEHAYVRYPTRDHKNVTHIGCKINEPQFRDRPAFFAEMIRWPALKAILVTRNVLESLRSFSQARQSGQWLKYGSDKEPAWPPLVRLSISDCEAYFKAADDFHTLVEHSFASTDLLVVEYEHLLNQPTACLEKVWDFLGVPPLERFDRAVLQRQETRTLDQTVQNFSELRLHFAEGPFARFFDVRDSD
ncbi:MULTISPECIES: sulfotransferase domain-containing protein [Mesorhizobium]|uniref:Beta-1,4-N-acetylglucosamine oligosaccharide 6-O-sulfotransferase NodH n=1 Tax=Mesorhizobium qingshengii TaxID=1165689 RepID=A0A1G5ZYA8_9HYPH|nr:MULTISPECIES: sulfotransferase domain-containing protein [Mesorhizobium]MCH4561222.1 sulfotransferase [Mesorhizobium jarvisii]QGU21232.1 sulfotransferase [Mesorhizobium huakuii 7653R]SDA99759.1 beta-1,4-N-acetylglucosamine oligosaccharide 6-O-sulfotransferase NodH [Mesorhizobium qingshengii]